MTTVRYNSVEERFVSFLRLFGDTRSGLIAVIETFASVEKFVQFVDVTCGAEAQPSWNSIHQPRQESRTENLLNAVINHAVRSQKTYSVYIYIYILFLHRSPEGC